MVCHISKTALPASYINGIYSIININSEVALFIRDYIYRIFEITDIFFTHSINNSPRSKRVKSTYNKIVTEGCVETGCSECLNLGSPNNFISSSTCIVNPNYRSWKRDFYHINP